MAAKKKPSGFEDRMMWRAGQIEVTHPPVTKSKTPHLDKLSKVVKT
jgi:hypothetical protein